MLASAITYTSEGRFSIDVANPPDVFCQGFGLTEDGLLCVTEDAPTGTTYNKGFRLDADGKLFVEDVSTATISHYIEGIPCTVDGAVVVESDDPTQFVSGNPITAAGAIAVD